MFRDRCDTPVVYGGGGHEGKYLLLFVFLIILFAVFRRGGGCFGGDDCGHGVGLGRGNWGPADFAAVNQVAQSIPLPVAELGKQAAVNEGLTIHAINQGNWTLSTQINDTAHAAEIRNMSEMLATSRMNESRLESRLLQQETINALSSRMCADQAATMQRLCTIESTMLKQPQVQGLAGLPHLSCVNAPFHNFHNVGRGCSDC